MHTTHLPTVHALVATRCQYHVGGSVQWDQRNKFAQVFSDGHQMSLAGGSPVPDVWKVGGWGIICLEGELNLGPGVSCKMRSRASGIMVTWDPPAPFVDI